MVKKQDGQKAGWTKTAELSEEDMWNIKDNRNQDHSLRLNMGDKTRVKQLIQELENLKEEFRDLSGGGTAGNMIVMDATEDRPDGAQFHTPSALNKLEDLIRDLKYMINAR